ncbi:TauD/TfdA dioxygenase family protein, partial [Nocardia aurea]
MSTLSTRHVSARIGSEISGVRLGGDLPADVVAEIRSTLLQRKVLFFRAQDHLDTEGQVAFARLLGEPTTAHPTVPALNGNTHVLDLDYKGGQKVDRWHTDVTFVDRPPLASVLRAVTVPEVGGDTLWANTVTAYEYLSAELRDLLDRLRAVHTNQYDYVRVTASDNPELAREQAEIFASTLFETEHPVVRVHPETGERSILLGDFAKRLVGLAPQASAAV